MRIFRQLTINDEKLEKFPFRRELSMQAYLMENEDLLKLEDSDIIQIYDEEVTIEGAGKKDKNGKNGDGRIDIIASIDNEQIAIVEIKKDEIDFDALEQLNRYLKKKDKLIGRNNPIIDKDLLEKKDIKWIGILVGSSIGNDLASQILSGKVNDEKDKDLKNISIAAITVERFKGKSGNVHIITNTYYQKKKGSKDKTKYEFNGKIYGKGPLALAVITEYVRGNNPKSLAFLKKAIPNEFHKNGNTKSKANQFFVSKSEAEKITINDRKRYFTKEEQIIHLSNDEEIAVNSQWGIKNIDYFIDKAEKQLKYKITKIK